MAPRFGILTAPMTIVYYDTGFILGLGGLIVGLFGGLVWLIAPERASFNPDQARAIAERTDAAPV